MKQLMRFLTLFLGVTLLLLAPITTYAIDGANVTVNSDESNRFGRYLISFNTAITGGFAAFFGGPQNNLRAGVDVITLTFDGTYELPSIIDATDVTVNGIQAANVVVSGNQIQITVGGDVNEGAVQIVLTTAARIRNPSTPATYSLTVQTSREAGSTADTYSIVAATTNIGVASVIPTPSVADTTAAYDVSFPLGAAGRLTTSSTVTLLFPSVVGLPTGFLTGVTLNNVATTAISQGDSVVVNVPTEVENEDLVTIKFSSGVGITNPNAGNYNVDIYTSSESSPITSETFSISAPTQLSFSTIILSDNSANATSSYQVQFITSTEGDLEFSATPDQIILGFPAQTTLPAAIDPVNITLDAEGFTGNPFSVQVSGQEIILAVPFDISAQEEVTISFSVGVGIVNPAEPGNYTISASTRTSALVSIDAQVSSNPYSIGFAPTSIANPAITLTSNNPNQTGVNYTFSFQTGNQGRLIGGVSTVSLVIPAGYGGTVTTTINGVAATGAVAAGVFTVTIPASVNIGSGENVTWVINNITNPPAGTYTFEMYSSVENTPVNSQNVYIGTGSFAISAFTKTNTSTNLASGYTFSFTGMTFSASGSLFGSGGSRYVQFTFPEGTVLPETMGVATINSNLTGNISEDYVTVNTSTRVVRVYYTVVTSLFGAAPRVNSIEFPASLNILNPAVPGASYTVGVSSSEEALTIPTSTYSISQGSGAVIVNSVSASPTLINSSNVAISVNISTSANGRLQGGTAFGSDSIRVDFGAGVSIPATISAGAVTINGASSGGVRVVSSGVGGEIRIAVPSGLTYAGGSVLNVVLTTTAQINTTATLSSSVVVSTDADGTTDSELLTLTSTAAFEVTSVAVSPNLTNGSAAYTVRFSTSSTGALTSGDEIVLTFPTNTFIPTTIGASLIRVNGIQPSLVGTASGQELTIIAPQDISAASSVTVSLNSGAGILNPSIPATNYTLDVRTTSDTSDETSPQYSIVSGLSSMATPSITISDITPSAAGVTYTISGLTGSLGRLSGSSGTITLTFPSGTNVSGATASVNGTGATINSASATSIELLTPLNIGNNESFTVQLSGVTNPVLGTYTFQIRSSSEPTNVSSSSYGINTNTPILINGTAVSDTLVNGAAQLTFTISTDGVSGALGAAGRVYILFPVGTQFPLTVAPSQITVNGVQVTSAIVNPLTRIVTLDPAQATIAAGSTFPIVVNSGANILTPSEPGNYVYRLYTSSQIAQATSRSVNFGPSDITLVSADQSSVAVFPQSATEPVTWTWTFTTGGRGALRGGAGQINLNLGGAVFSSGVSASNITVNGAVAQAVQRSGSLVTITIPPTITINNNTAVIVQVSSGAGIFVNPSLALKQARKKAPTDENPFGSYEINALDEFEIFTSPEPTPVQLESNPLPITLSSFTVESQEGVVSARWETATEEDNYGFYIERAQGLDDTEIDEQPEYLEWAELGFVEGAGTSYEPNEYLFEDRTANQAGLYYYRIRQVDYNTNFEIFGPESVLVGVPEHNELKTNYPNPFNPTTTIPFAVSEVGNVQIQVFDLTGRLISTLVNQRYSPGRYQVLWDARAYASGTYFITMRVNGFFSTKMITLLK